LSPRAGFRPCCKQRPCLPDRLLAKTFGVALNGGSLRKGGALL
jgi:hypothetical protein